MKRFRLVLLVFVIMAMATLACGLNVGSLLGRSGGEEASAPQPTQALPTVAPPPTAEVAVQPTETPVGEAQEAPAPTEAPAESAPAEAEEAELDLDTSVSGLQNLSSYRAVFRFEWSGTTAGEPVTGYMEMRSAFVREPAAQELYFEGQGMEGGQDQGLGQVAFVQVGDTAWFYEGESDTWMQVPAGSLDFAEGLFFQPQDLLQDFDVIKGRRNPIPKQVNGVQCYVYTFDESDFDLTVGPQVARADGEVCVAEDGGYVVQLIVDADFRYSDPDEMFEEGNVKMTFDISDVNQPITIEPPADAEAQAGGRDDIPMLPDAEVDFSSGELISYRTTSSVADAVQFYQDQMSANGWTPDENSMVFDENALLHYNKGSETADVVIGRDENGTNVLITIGQQ